MRKTIITISTITATTFGARVATIVCTSSSVVRQSVHRLVDVVRGNVGPVVPSNLISHRYERQTYLPGLLPAALPEMLADACLSFKHDMCWLGRHWMGEQHLSAASAAISRG